MADTAKFRTSGGWVIDLALPLSDDMQAQVTRRQLLPVDEPPTGPKRPADSALKPEWVGYALAVDKDLTVDDADAMTKNDLIEKYGK